MQASSQIPAHLPKRLSISFPIWGLHDTPPGGAYHDLERMVVEHVERGFNCIRLDDGAGLIHDFEGRRLGPTKIVEPFPGHSANIRQSFCTGPGGECDLLARLFALFEAAKKHDVYIILSSWYYLHTCWYCGDETLNAKLHAIAPHERFMHFAKALDYIIQELKRRNLHDRIAFAEVFNEADGLNFIDGYDSKNHLSKKERNSFRDEHAQAIGFLRERHPDILFAYDTYTPYTDLEQMPDGLQVWNFHNYFLWSVYSAFEGGIMKDGMDFGNAKPFLYDEPIPFEAVRSCRNGRIEAQADWYRRVWLYRNLDPAKVPALDRLLAGKLRDEFERYKSKIVDSLAHARMLADERLPGIPLVMGEGVSYCASNLLLWEERSEEYWELLEFAVRQYKKAGLWGCVLRTCCGPEDPCWNMSAKRLRRLNELFQAE